MIPTLDSEVWIPMKVLHFLMGFVQFGWKAIKVQTQEEAWEFLIETNGKYLQSATKDTITAAEKHHMKRSCLELFFK